MSEHVDVSKCTPGPATSRQSVPFSEVVGGDGLPICDTHSRRRTLREYQANAALIAEAFTVASEIGKGPKQLAKENAKMLKFITQLAKQHLETEMSEDEAEGGDYRGAYDAIVKQARSLVAEKGE